MLTDSASYLIMKIHNHTSSWLLDPIPDAAWLNSRIESVHGVDGHGHNCVKYLLMFLNAYITAPSL